MHHANFHCICCLFVNEMVWIVKNLCRKVQLILIVGSLLALLLSNGGNDTDGMILAAVQAEL